MKLVAKNRLRRGFVRVSHPYLIPALIAGVMQGVVEWLPISSKTMITLYFALLGVKLQNAYNLGLIANFGSFFAAAYYFRREVWLTLKALAHPFSDQPYARLLRFLVGGTLATGIIGIPLYLFVRQTFTVIGGSAAMLGIGVLLLITGVVARRKELLLARASHHAESTQPVTLWAAVITGGMQGLAALPGISRSGMTITPLLWMGFSGKEAIRLSFMLDVLALVGAGVVPMVIGHGGVQAVVQFGTEATLLMVAVATLVSFLAISGVLTLAQRLRTSTVTFGIGGITLLVAVLAVWRL